MMVEIDFPFTVSILVFLLLASAFFSGSETALTRSRRFRLRSLSKEGNQGALEAEKLLAQPEKMLTAILLGNNFVNIAASSLATALFVAYFGEAGILYATIAMTTVILIFSEILPKTLAVAHAEGIACRVSRPLAVLMKLMAPLIAAAMVFIRLAQRLFKIPHGQEAKLTHQELATIIDMGAKTGVLDALREQMLAGSLALHEVPVKALMTPRKDMVLLDGERLVGECLQFAVDHPHSRYPVYVGKSDNIIAIVHIRDLVRHIDQKEKRLVDILSGPHPMFVPANKNALSQLVDFQSQRQHMAIIVNEYGDIEGLITLEDIIEDIVGEIADESDVLPLPEIWTQPDGSLIVAGTASVHDVNQALDIELPEEGATTIGGLMIEMLGGEPEGLVCVRVDDVCMEALSIHDHWIKRIRIFKRQTD